MKVDDQEKTSAEPVPKLNAEDSAGVDKKPTKAQAHAQYIAMCQQSACPAAYIRHDIMIQLAQSLPDGENLTDLWVGHQYFTDNEEDISPDDQAAMEHHKHEERWYFDGSEEAQQDAQKPKRKKTLESSTKQKPKGRVGARRRAARAMEKQGRRRRIRAQRRGKAQGNRRMLSAN